MKGGMDTIVQKWIRRRGACLKPEEEASHQETCSFTNRTTTATTYTYTIMQNFFCKRKRSYKALQIYQAITKRITS